MDAAQPAQIVVVERLHPERDPVDPGIAIARKAAGLDGAGVGLQRDLDVIGKGPVGAGGLDHRRDGLRRHQARGASAEEDRVQHAARGALRNPCDFALIGSNPSGLVYFT